MAQQPRQMRQWLLIRSSQPENVYGRFAGEILKSEGFNGFDLVDLDAESLPELTADDVAILTRCFLHKAEIEQLLAMVRNGARLICLQPSWTLAAQLGWKSRKRVTYPGWIDIAEGYPGSGTPIQAHVPIAEYDPPDQNAAYTIAARAVRSDWTNADCPAAVVQSVGRGKIALFFYDLPEAVARIRFGNPDLASHLTSGQWGWPHASDLFDGHVDERVINLPQADFHGQFLAKVLTDIAAHPQPRLWYYPDAAQRSAAVFQSDGDLSEPQQFAALSDCLLQHRGAGTFYLMAQTKLTPSCVADLRAKGHTFGPHVFGVDGEDDLYFRFPQRLDEETQRFKQRFGEPSRTIQCHYAPWMGYMNWLADHVRHGYRLLFAYLSIPPQRLNTYMCGSGRPIRFYDRDGTTYPCWQQPVISYDDSSLAELMGNNPAPLLEKFEANLQASINRTHSAFGILSHPVSFCTYSRPYMEACFDRLTAEGVPICNGDQWCDHLERRDAVRVRTLVNDDNSLTCIVSNLTGRQTLMIPLATGHAPQLDGATRVRRLEQDYLFIPLEGDGSEIHLNIPAVPKAATQGPST